MRDGTEGRVVAIAPAVAQFVEINARSIQSFAQPAFVLRDRLRFSEMRRQSAVDSRFNSRGVLDHAGREGEIIRFPAFSLTLEPPVGTTASDADGKSIPLDPELELVRIAPAVAEGVDVNGLARPQLAFQRFAVANEAAGPRVMAFDRSSDGRGGVEKVRPRFAEPGEVIVRIEAFVRPCGDQFEPVVDRIDRESRTVR